MKHMSAATALCFALHLVPAGALAQAEPQEAASSDPKENEYRRQISDGLAEFQRGNYLEARTLIESAHRLSPSARTLRALGAIEYELRHYIKAREYFLGALNDQRKPLTDAMRAEVEANLSRADRFIGRVTVHALPVTAVISVDGRPAHSEERDVIMLDPGEHTLTASSPGLEPQSKRLDVRGGERFEWEVQLRPPEPPKSGPLAGGSAPKDDDGTIFGEWWFWGAAVVVIGGGVAASFILLSKEETEDPLPGDGMPFQL